jgi:hypothetical protein
MFVSLQEDAKPQDNQKALPLGRKSSGSTPASRGRASTLPATMLAVGPVHSLIDNDVPGRHGARTSRTQQNAQWKKKVSILLDQEARTPVASTPMSFNGTSR